MYIRIYDIEDIDKRNEGFFKRLRNRKHRTEISGEYKGIDRNFTSWSDTSRLSKMTDEGLAKYIEYVEFEMDSDGCDELRQADYIKYYKYDNLNENKLLNTFEEAKEILDLQPYCEVMQKNEILYVYKYKY